MALASIQISPQLALVLNNAGQKNNVDFDYLLQTAIRESSLNPHAKAKTSSATGLFQFLESTWLEIMKTEGARLGYSQYSNAIERDSEGNYFVRDKNLRHEILELRKNPQIAADLAAAFTRKNGEYLTKRFGRMPSAGELYIAHFLGAKGAEKLFAAALENPNQIAAELFPKAAKANRAIFYENNQPRTLKQLYLALVAKHNVQPNMSEFNVQQLANDRQIGSDDNQEKVKAPNISFSEIYSNSPIDKRNSAKIFQSKNNLSPQLFVQLYSK